eukprot:m.715916 g.715916  ORF g.715916 m.715916 type:complete len:58 (+) comp22980_c1_seq26:212-385(+)
MTFSNARHPHDLPPQYYLAVSPRSVLAPVDDLVFIKMVFSQTIAAFQGMSVAPAGPS